MLAKKVSRVYTIIAILLLNTVLIFVGLNIAIFVYGQFDEDSVVQPQPPIRTGTSLVVHKTLLVSRDFDLLRQIYYYREDGDIIFLLLETENLVQICDDDTFFREAPYSGRYYKIDPAGFRWIGGQGPWPPSPDAFNIFVFGGSTTFGYGEANHLSIPSNIQYILRENFALDQINVYNFGRAAYYSLQEKLLFESLVEDGYVPDMAIFIDGMNDFTQGAVGQPQNFSNCVEQVDLGHQLSSTVSCEFDELCLPVQQLATNLLDVDEASSNDNKADLPLPPNDDVETNIGIIEHWLENKNSIEQIAKREGVKLLFVMQPVSGYAYDQNNHLFKDKAAEVGFYARPKRGYPVWEEMYENSEAEWTGNVLNLSRLGEDNQGPIYLDSIHYTAGFMEEIAQAITDAIIEKPLSELDPDGDQDADGIPNVDDNCVQTSNPDQADNWGSDLGDACDTEWYEGDDGVKAFQQKDNAFHIWGCDEGECHFVANFDPKALTPENTPQRFESEESMGWNVDVQYLDTDDDGNDIYQVSTFDTEVLRDDELEIIVKPDGTSEWRART